MPVVTTLPKIFRDTVQRHAGRAALMRKESGRYRTMTYGTFAEEVDLVALSLIEAGVGVGERVAILSENRPEWAIADQAILAAGAVVVPIYPTLTGSQVAYMLADCAACAVVVSSADQAAKLMAIAEQVPSLRHVIVMDPAFVPADPRVRSWANALARGEAAREPHTRTLMERQEALRSGDLASIVYTSGTTGEPKGAMLTHGNFSSNALTAASIIGVREDDVELSFLPLSHVLERVVSYAAISVGAAIAYAESIETLSQNLQEVQPTFLVSVPRVLEKVHARVLTKMEHETPLKRELFWAALEIGEFYHKVMREEGRVVFPTNVLYQAADKLVFKPIRDNMGGKLRFVVSGGAPLAPEVGLFFQTAGIPVVEGYGLTETSPVITINPPDRTKFGTVGLPIDGVEARLAEDGEILVRGPNVMRGYWNKDEATRETLDEDGWLRTGDIGRFDAEGYLAIVDRKKELIVMSNGKNVAPQPLENRLTQHPVIEQAMVVGDRRNYLTVLVSVDMGVAEHLAKATDERWSSPEELLATATVRHAIENAIARENTSLAPFEQIKRWAVVSQSFSQETGELTPTLKLKRRVILDKYRHLVDAMYAASERKSVAV